MKTLITSFALSLGLCVAWGASAQTTSSASVSAPDTVLMSEHVDGDFLVRQYRIKHQSGADYTLRFASSLAKLSTSLGNNLRELDGINAFIEQMMRDTLIDAESVDITGFSSPDGSPAYNKTLAQNRAQDVRNYIDGKYDFSKKFKVSVKSEVDDWASCRPLVEQSSMPDKQAVIKILDSDQSSVAKEASLRRLPQAWSYIKTQILPQLRRVELTINYDQAKVYEQRLAIARPEPEPTPEPAPQTCTCIAIDDGITGIIVEMPDSQNDF